LAKAASKKTAPKKTIAKKSANNATTKTRATNNAVKRVSLKRIAAVPQMSVDDIRSAFARWSELNPHPTTELEYSSPFELLVAVVLSAQATDVGVNKATRRLFPVANTPQAIAALGIETLKSYISTIGLFNTKAANVIALCKKLIAEHGGEVPRDRAALEALPGVGRKTANVVLNTAFGEPTMAVDTHIFRVSNRTGLAPGKDVLAVERALLARVPSEYLQDAHHWLILHGRYTCIARKPACGRCPIRDLCKFKDKNEDAAT
jgi:endonuclease III